MLETIENLCQDFFKKLTIDFSKITVETEAKNIYKISLKSEDSHLLIGPHGKNLETLTHLLKLIISRKLKEHINIHLEVNDYQQQKDEKLIQFIKSKITQVKESWKVVVLPFFTAYERKKVHSYVSEYGGNVFTQSKWEWSERKIHLCKKEEKMSIDIDGDDI